MKDVFVECSSEDFMVCKSTKYAIMSPANWIAGEVGNYVAIGRGVPEVGGGGGSWWWGCATHLSKSRPYFRPTHVVVYTRFQTWPLR